MRDAILNAVWDEGHERYSQDLDVRLHAAKHGIKRRISTLPDTARHGLLMVAAVVASAATLTLATPAGAAQAPIEVTAPSVAVSYADLDIRTRAGRQTLDARTRQAARLVCQPDLAGITAERLERRACYRDAVAGARGQVSAAVTAFARNRPAGGRSVTVTAR